MTTNEEFAADIRTAPVTGGNDVDLSRPLAKHLQDLGYRKPRTITNLAELDAMQDGGIVRSAEGDAWQKFNICGWAPAGGMPATFKIHDIALPATVLHDPAAQ